MYQKLLISKNIKNVKRNEATINEIDNPLLFDVKKLITSIELIERLYSLHA